MPHAPCILWVWEFCCFGQGDGGVGMLLQPPMKVSRKLAAYLVNLNSFDGCCVATSRVYAILPCGAMFDGALVHLIDIYIVDYWTIVIII